jgi:hypothetical protein
MEATALLRRLNVLGVVANDVSDGTSSRSNLYLPPVQGTLLLGEEPV